MNLSPLWKQIRGRRPRLLIALLLGLIAYVLVPRGVSPPVRFILGWDLGIVAFLVLFLIMVARSTPRSLRYRAQLEDEKAWVLLALIVGAALASFLAIGFILHDAKEMHGWLATINMSLAGATILLSWLMAHTMFALHFAHAFYGDHPDMASGAVRPGDASVVDKIAGGLAFPGEEPPDYWDFLYFAFVIGMTCQVSDVQVTSRPMRRLTLCHGVISFLFNTVILALCINLLASLL